MNFKNILLILVATLVLSLGATMLFLKISSPKNNTVSPSQKSAASGENEERSGGFFAGKKTVDTEADLQKILESDLLAFKSKIKLKVGDKIYHDKGIERVIDKILTDSEATSHVDSLSWSAGQKLTGIELNIYPNYLFSKKDNEQINRFVDKWIAQNIHSKMSDEQKIKKIHDHIVSQYHYNEGDEKNMLGGYSVHSPCSLVYGQGGVCQGYATLFKKMSVASGIKTKLISGNSVYNTNPDVGHLWNMVQLGDNWYHIDTTWDDPTGVDGSVVYDFYLKSDRYMSITHTWNAGDYPPAKADFNNDYKAWNVNNK